MDARADAPPVPRETVVEMARLKGLIDAVVAFALTVLVIDIRLPAGTAVADVPDGLLDLAPELGVYLISFVVIGGAWLSQQRLLGQIEHGDGLTAWFALLWLLPVTLLPFCAAVLGDHPTDFVPMALFALDVLFVQLTALWLWRHAGRNRLLPASLDPRAATGIGRRLQLAAVGFGVSIVIAYVAPAVAYATWVGVFASIFTTDFLSWQEARRATALAIPLGDTAEARIEVEHAAGRLAMAAGAGEGTLLRGAFGGGVESDLSREAGRTRLRLSLPRRAGLLSRRFPWSWGEANLVDWALDVTERIPLELAVQTAGGESCLDLEHLRVSRLRLQTSASRADVTLPGDGGSTTAEIEASGASVILRIPHGVAAAIHVEASIASTEVDLARFPVVVDRREYRSPDFDAAVNRVDVRVKLAIGSLEVV